MDDAQERVFVLVPGAHIAGDGESFPDGRFLERRRDDDDRTSGRDDGRGRAFGAVPLDNTVVVAGSTVTIVLVVSSMAAYGVSRFVFRGKLTFLLALLLAQVMPVTTLIIPLYVFWSRLSLADGPIALIATYSAISIPVGTWLLLGFVNGIPRQLDEAATIDGATSRIILLRIIGPLLAPGSWPRGSPCSSTSGRS